MDNNSVIILLCAVCIFIIVQFVLRSREEKRRIHTYIHNLWGTRPIKEYSYEEFDNMSNYFRRNKDKNAPVIDDITWNDLDMDSIFMLADQTLSSPGASYLYELLRKPVLELSTLLERDRMIRFFMEHETEREKIQHILHQYSGPKKLSTSDYIEILRQAPAGKNLSHYCMIAAFFVSVVTLIVHPASGILIFFSVAAFNITFHFRGKKKIDPYLKTLFCVLDMMECGKRLSNASYESDPPCIEALRTLQPEIRKIRRFSFLIINKAGLARSIFDIPLDYLRLVLHFDLIRYNHIIQYTQQHMSSIYELFRLIGTLDSMIAVGSFRMMFPASCTPEFKEGADAMLQIENGYHPMIDNPVKNSISENKGVLITGSNASGKSTFLKTTAISCILAQTFYIVPADRYCGNFFRIYSSMALKDNLMEQESYYMVEIKSLKRILDTVPETDAPMLCFIDEVLRGTNTVERIAASSQILKSLAKPNIICFAATHDVELTHILEKEYANYHFQEEIKENDILFDYKLHTGRSFSRNAIKLLSIIGYEDNIIQEAEKLASDFLSTGVWSQT